MANTELLWTVDELAARAALALADSEGQPSGRVRDVPDVRTIRYYTTLGLLDRPAEMHGRTALYGARHLLQLAAIKRLQARGLALAAIQQQLLGLTDAGLKRIARLPADAVAELPSPAPEPPRGRRPECRSRPFWRQTPGPVEERPRGEGQPGPEVPPREPVAPEAQDVLPLQGVRLGEGATLLLDAARPLAEDDVEALRAAAAPLLKLLEARRLLGPDLERGTR
jgi:MerR HTH family regulatory protein